MLQIPDSILQAETLEAALAETLRHFTADSGTVHLLESDGVLHLKAASTGIPAFVLDAVRLVPVGKGMAGLAVARSQPVTACNIQTDTSGDVRAGARATGLEGAIVVPMVREGKAIGAFGIANRAERTFSGEEQELLLAVAAHLAERHG
ncbi:MAG TPA: GAF domain-containing protein [Bryobacteraceae bacterium]|nr:GAF domain-containing protein [Bryobacteraceae bacterium]